MKLFYLPDTKAIVAKYNNKFVSLPNAEEIEKPAKLIPCQPFLKERKTSKWFDVPESHNPDIDGFYIHLDKYHLAGLPNRRPSKIKIHKIELDVTYTTNEVGEPWFQLSGKVPHYVLNGIANVLKEEYYDSIK
jgi:hypothetical protein|nr:MAG TPA: hypothetical protein [Caudoviricetes sp.]